MNTKIATEDNNSIQILLFRYLLVLALIIVFFFFESIVFYLSFVVVLLFWYITHRVKKGKCVRFKRKKVVFCEKNKKYVSSLNRFQRVVYIPSSYDLFLIRNANITITEKKDLSHSYDMFFVKGKMKIRKKEALDKKRQEKIIRQFNLRGFTQKQIEQILLQFQNYGKEVHWNLQSVDIPLLSEKGNMDKFVENSRNIDLG